MPFYRLSTILHTEWTPSI